MITKYKNPVKKLERRLKIASAKLNELACAERELSLLKHTVVGLLLVTTYPVANFLINREIKRIFVEIGDAGENNQQLDNLISRLSYYMNLRQTVSDLPDNLKKLPAVLIKTMIKLPFMLIKFAIYALFQTAKIICLIVINLTKSYNAIFDKIIEKDTNIDQGDKGRIKQEIRVDTLPQLNEGTAKQHGSTFFKGYYPIPQTYETKDIPVNSFRR